MLMLSRQLHWEWSQGKFALEFVAYDKRVNEERKVSSSDSSSSSSSSEQSLPATTKAPTSKASTSKASTSKASTSKTQPAASDSLLSTPQRVPSKRLQNIEEAKASKKIKLEEEEAEKKRQENTEYGLILRFHWLKKTKCHGLHAPYPKDKRASNVREKMFVKWDRLDNVFTALDAVPVDSGQIVTIWAKDKKLLPNRDLITLQFHALLLHRMSGGADPDLYIPQKDQDDDEELAARAAAAKKYADDMIAKDEARAALVTSQPPASPPVATTNTTTTNTTTTNTTTTNTTTTNTTTKASEGDSIRTSKFGSVRGFRNTMMSAVSSSRRRDNQRSSDSQDEPATPETPSRIRRVFSRLHLPSRSSSRQSNHDTAQIDEEAPQSNTSPVSPPVPPTTSDQPVPPPQPEVNPLDPNRMPPWTRTPVPERPVSTPTSDTGSVLRRPSRHSLAHQGSAGSLGGGSGNRRHSGSPVGSAYALWLTQQLEGLSLEDSPMSTGHRGDTASVHSVASRMSRSSSTQISAV